MADGASEARPTGNAAAEVAAAARLCDRSVTLSLARRIAVFVCPPNPV